MSRRPVGIQILIVVGVVGLFLFGLYQYNDVQTRLKRSDEKNEKLKQEQDSLSTQLKVLYELKSKLEKSVAHEQTEHSKTKQTLQDEKKELESKLTREKLTLEERVSALTSENKRIQSLYDDLQSDVGKKKEQLAQLEEDKAKELEQYKQEYMQLKQERENEVAQLKDRIADLERRNDLLKSQNENAVKNAEDHQIGRKGNAKTKKPRLIQDTGNNNANGDEENGGILQIKKPDDGKPKGYFEVKPAKQEGESIAVVDRIVHQGDHEQGGNGNAAADTGDEKDERHMQVAPPNHDKNLKQHAVRGANADVAGPQSGGLAAQNRGNLANQQNHDIGYRAQLDLPGGSHQGDKVIPGDVGIPNGHGNPGANGLQGDLGHNAGVGGQGEGAINRGAIGGRLGNNGVEGHGIDSAGAGGANAGQNAQIALPQVQQQNAPPAGDNGNGNDERNDGDGDDNNGDDEPRVVGRRGGGEAADNHDVYDDDKKGPEQDRRGPNVGPVDPAL